MPSIADILLGKAGETADLFLYQVLGQVVGALLAPYLTSLQQDSMSGHPVAALTPAEAATLVLRGWWTEPQGAQEAAQSGVDAERFAKLWRGAGLPIAPQAAAEALRRGIIPESSGSGDAPSFENAIRQGDLASWWAPVVKKLALQEPTPNDALQALLEGQIPDAQARQLYEQFGGDPAYFQMMFDSRGNAPTPVEALQMANRRIIPWDGEGPASVSYHQAFLEGPWRNKWEAPFRALGKYVPPPRTVTTLLRSGAMTQEQAAQAFQDSGMTPELAAIYVHSVMDEKLQAHKNLAESTVLNLYADHFIPKSEALTLLKDLGWDDQEAAFIIEVRDAQRYQRNMAAAVKRLEALYINHKVLRRDIMSALATLQLGSEEISHLLSIWDLELANNLKILTEAQVVAAWDKNVLDQDTAISELKLLGYSAYDAWVLLSTKNGGPLDNQPPKGDNPL